MGKVLRHITKNKFFKLVKENEPWIEVEFNNNGTYIFSDHNVDTRKFIEGETYQELDRNTKSGHIQCRYYLAEVRPNIWRVVPINSVKLVNDSFL